METWIQIQKLHAPCSIIAEIAQAHDGSLGMAHAYIDAAAQAGADAVKFQTHIAREESTPDEPWRTRFSPYNETRYEYWQRMEFTEEQWIGLKTHADRVGLAFLSSPFSLKAVDLLERVGVAAWKVASGEISNYPLLDTIVKTGKPIMLSTGMSPLSEVDEVVEHLRRANVPLAVLQCTTNYPSLPEEIGLNVLQLFRERYCQAVGISDHSGTIYPALAAATLGVEVIEVHITLSREMFGPDVVASVTTSEMKQLVEGVRFIEFMRSHPIDKTIISEHIESQRRVFMKSIMLKEDLPKGTVLRAEYLAMKKPANGISPRHFEQLIGRRLKKKVKKDVPLEWDDLEVR